MVDLELDLFIGIGIDIDIDIDKDIGGGGAAAAAAAALPINHLLVEMGLGRSTKTGFLRHMLLLAAIAEAYIFALPSLPF